MLCVGAYGNLACIDTWWGCLTHTGLVNVWSVVTLHSLGIPSFHGHDDVSYSYKMKTKRTSMFILCRRLRVSGLYLLIIHSRRRVSMNSVDQMQLANANKTSDIDLGGRGPIFCIILVHSVWIKCVYVKPKWRGAQWSIEQVLCWACLCSTACLQWVLRPIKCYIKKTQ